MLGHIAVILLEPFVLNPLPCFRCNISGHVIAVGRREIPIKMREWDGGLCSFGGYSCDNCRSALVACHQKCLVRERGRLRWLESEVQKVSY